MSTTGNNQLFTVYDYGKIFIWNPRYRNLTYTNSTGSTVNLAAGTLMGTILLTGLAKPQLSSSTDGSEMPRGVLGQNYTVGDGETIEVSICIAGDVNQSLITLGAGDTLTTPVRTVSTGGGTIGDLLLANTGIILVPSTDQTYLDYNA